MKVIAGRYAGRTGRLVQYANNWINVDLDAGRSVIVSPAVVRVDPAERDRFAPADPSLFGSFFTAWRLEEDGTFTCLLEQPARARPGRRRKRSPRAPLPQV